MADDVWRDRKACRVQTPRQCSRPPPLVGKSRRTGWPLPRPLLGDGGLENIPSGYGGRDDPIRTYSVNNHLISVNLIIDKKLSRCLRIPNEENPFKSCVGTLWKTLLI